MSKGLGGKFISIGTPKKLAGGQILILPTVINLLGLLAKNGMVNSEKLQ